MRNEHYGFRFMNIAEIININLEVESWIKKLKE
jgi:hypothetical protein